MFDLRGNKAQETTCKAECTKHENCIAFSGIWNDWCVGCSLALDDSSNEEHVGTIAFKKDGKVFKFLLFLLTKMSQI